MVTAEAELANITADPVALIPTENFAMGFYILIIGELHQQLQFLIWYVNNPLEKIDDLLFDKIL